MIVTITMNLFAFPYQQMIPVLGAEKLMVDPVFVGLLLSVEGLGATLGALTIAAPSHSPDTSLASTSMHPSASPA